jgi:putative nucleotidyltransferase with HDIG domain
MNLEGVFCVIQVKKINQLFEGDIVGKSIYIGKTLLIAQGTVIRPHIIQRLRNYKITEVPIIVRPPEQTDQQVETQEATNEEGTLESVLSGLYIWMEQQSKHDADKHEQKKFAMFFEGMKRIVSESRYGLAFNQTEALSYVYELWRAILSEPHYFRLINQLREWDLTTYYHSLDTFILGSLLVKHIGMGNERLFATACLFHDIGKLRIPRKILANEGKLTAEEYEIIKMHVEYGVRILAQRDRDRLIVPIVKQHHERMDGSGYPDGRRGNQIEPYARLLTIIDVYSALTLERPYRKAISSVKALEVMLHESRLYDPYILREFMQMIHIYPVYSCLELTNKWIVIVTEVNPQVPHLPTVTSKEYGITFQIPRDFSVSVRRFHTWEGMQDTKKQDRLIIEELQNSFQNYLLLGEGARAISLIRSLINTIPLEIIPNFESP